MNRKRQKQNKKERKKRKMEPPANLDELLGDIGTTLKASEEIIEAEPTPDPRVPNNSPGITIPVDDREAEIRAWYIAESRKRALLVQRINFIASALAQVANSLTPQRQIADGILDLYINLPVLGVQLDTAIKAIKGDLSAALKEAQETLAAQASAEQVK